MATCGQTMVWIEHGCRLASRALREYGEGAIAQRRADLVGKRITLAVIDTVYPFENVPHAFRHFSEGRFKRKVVIRIHRNVLETYQQS